MKFSMRRNETPEMDPLDKLKSFAATVEKPMKAKGNKRSEIHDYIQNLEHEKELLESSEDEDTIEQIIAIDTKIDSANKMLQKTSLPRYSLKKSNDLLNKYNEFYKEYVQEFKGEIDPDIQQIHMYSNEIKKLLDKVRKKQTDKYIELSNVVGTITPHVDNDVVTDFQNTLRRIDRIFPANAASEKFREWIRQLEN